MLRIYMYIVTWENVDNVSEKFRLENCTTTLIYFMVNQKDWERMSNKITVLAWKDDRPFLNFSFL